MSNAAIKLEAKTRDRAGKGGARATRRADMIPAVLYGGETAPQLIALSRKQLEIQVQRSGFFSHLLDLELDGKTQRVLARDVQMDAVTDRPLHVDFLRVTANTRIRVEIPVVAIDQNKSSGVKRGGVINMVRHSVTAICPAEAIPERIEVSVDGLDIGDSIHLSQITLPANVRVLTGGEKDLTLVSIAVPTTTTEEAKTTPDAALTTAAAPAGKAGAKAAAPAAGAKAPAAGAKAAPADKGKK